MNHINPEELQDLMSRTSVHLIDVREPDEHAEFNIGGQLIPLANILHQADDIPTHGTVVVYCRKGVRSQIAIQKLQERFGMEHLLNLKGGMEAWKKTFTP